MVVSFCQQLRMRDCKNVQVMLYTQSDPVVESCTNITFFAPTYSYPELYLHMRKAKVSIWENLWSSVYDFTPDKKADDGKPNWSLSKHQVEGFISQFTELQKLVQRVSKLKGGAAITSLEDIKEEDLKLIEFEEEPDEEAVDLGQHFNKY